MILYDTAQRMSPKLQLVFTQHDVYHWNRCNDACLLLLRMLGYELHPYKCFTPIQHTKDILEPNIFLQTKTFETFPPCPPCVHCYVPYVPCVAGGKWPCWAVPCGASTRSWDVWCESLEAEIPWVKKCLAINGGYLLGWCLDMFEGFW